MQTMQLNIICMYFLTQVYASKNPLQSYINFYVFSYKSLCIYANYAAVKLVCISNKSLCIFASYVYKLVCIFLKKFTHLCILCI